MNGFKRNPDGTVTIRFYEIVDDLPAFADGGLVQAAHAVKGAGRWGDEILIHVNPEELEQMRQAWGDPTINPHTGLPEYGFLSKLWKAVKKILPVAVAFIPGIGPAVGAALGATGTTASVIGNALVGAATGAISNGGKGALIGGLTGGLGGLGAASKVGSALGLSGPMADIVGQGLVSGGVGAIAGQDFGQSALSGALSAFASPLLKKGISALSDSGAGATGAQTDTGSTADSAIDDLYVTPTATRMGDPPPLASIAAASPLQDLNLSDSIQRNTLDNTGLLKPSDVYPINPEDARTGPSVGSDLYSSNIDHPLTNTDVDPSTFSSQGNINIDAPPEVKDPTFLQSLKGEVQGIGSGLMNFAKENPLEATIGVLNLIHNISNQNKEQNPIQTTGVVGNPTTLPAATYNRRVNPLKDLASYYTYGEKGSGGHRWFDYTPAPPTVNAQPVPPDPLFGMAHGGALNYVRHRTMAGGRADNIPARLSENEYVVDAETVALLGDGNPDAGAKKLDVMRSNIRKHKGRALMQGRISPDAGDPLQYMRH